MEKALYWFRSDLRLHDNPVARDAFANSRSLSFVYVHDPRLWQISAAGIPRTGWHRRRFLRQSLDDLRGQLARVGFELLEIWGEPERVLPELMDFNSVDVLYFSKECAPAEKNTETKLKGILVTAGRKVSDGWTQFLLEPQQLPFSADRIPAVFTEFRKGVEAVGVESLVPAELILDKAQIKSRPLRLSCPGEISLKNVLKIIDVSVSSLDDSWWLPIRQEEELVLAVDLDNVPDEKSKIIQGGARAAVDRLNNYFFESRAALSYFSTRNGMLDAADSTLFSPWLANGCLSARQVFNQLKKCESIHGANKSTYWIVFELLWREFFRFHLLASGEHFFEPGGLFRVQQKEEFEAEKVEEKIRDLLSCRSGHVFVDASVRELILTGFMSNRGRQNVASHMIYNMEIPWWMGAAVFESLLIDYDAASNWGNWSYIAGVSFDPRGGRHFNLDKQQRDYDPDGAYVKAWSSRV